MQVLSLNVARCNSLQFNSPADTATIQIIQARRNRSGRSGPGPTKNRRPCIIIITTTLASCLAATSAGGGASFLEAKCVNRIPVHCSCADVRISCSCKDGVQFSLSCCCSSYDAGTSVSSQPFFRFSEKNLLGKKRDLAIIDT